MKRLKGKLLLSFLIMVSCCTTGVLVKAQKIDNLCFVGEVNSSGKGTEVAVELGKSLKERIKEKKINKMYGGRKYEELNKILEFPCRDLRNSHPNIYKFVYDGITYEVTEDKKEGTLLILTGDEGCSPSPYTSIFPALNVWGGYEFKDAKVEYRNGDTEETQYKNLVEPKIKVDQVIIRGCIKVIPRDFLTPPGKVKNDNPFRERDGEPEYFNAGMTKVWRVDMSGSDVEGIESGGFYNFGALKEVILPSHPVKARMSFWIYYEHEQKNGIPEDKRQTKLIRNEYLNIVDSIYEQEGCCSVQ